MIGQAPRIATNHSRTRITLTALSTRHLTTAPPDCAASPPPYAHAAQPTASTCHSATLGVILNRPRSLRSRASLADRPAPFRYASCFAHRPADTSCVGARHNVARPRAVAQPVRRDIESSRKDIRRRPHSPCPSTPHPQHVDSPRAEPRTRSLLLLSLVPISWTPNASIPPTT